MVLAIRKLLVIEIVDERDKPPRVFVLAVQPRVAAHGRFDRQQVLSQTLALHMLGDECPGAIACQHGDG
jgi:hypothetical protein